MQTESFKVFWIVALFLLAICSCKTEPQSSENEKKSNQIVMELNQDIRPTKEILTKLSLQEAIKKYTNRLEEDQFVIDGSLPEFRIELYNIYSEKEFNAKKIEMREITWELDDAQNITVWYELKGEHPAHPVHTLVWTKGSSF